jgi:hypothetical protein
MKAKIEQLTPAEQDWISQQIEAAKEFVSETLGEGINDLPSPQDLDRAFDAWLNSPSHDPADANFVVNCVGIAFGQHLVNSTPLKWVIATDGYGTELAIYGFEGTGDVLVYPQNFVAKSYEAKSGIFIVESIKQMQADVSKIENRSSPKRPWKFW